VSDVVPDVGRHAVLVDAGYLYASVGQLVLGRTSRREFRVAAEPLIGALMARADRTTPGGLLRMYWYDAARDRVPTVEQRQIAALPNVKVRLGNLNSAGQQKGVDAQLRQDLELLAKHRAVSDVVLIAGDEDMVPAVEAAQAYGVRVHVWGVEPPYGVNQAERLVWEADTVNQLDVEFCRPYLELEPGVGEEEAAVAAEPREERHAVPTPADVFAARKLGTPPPKPVAVAAGPPDRPERPDRPGPERPEMEQIGARIAARWLLTRGRENVADLLPGPVLPTVIDKELLVEAEEEISRSLRPYEEARRALRDGFWAKLHQDFGIQPASVPPHPTADLHPATPPPAAAAHPTPAPDSHPGPASPPPPAQSGPAAPVHSDSAAPAHPDPAAAAHSGPAAAAAADPGPAAAADPGPAAAADPGPAPPGLSGSPAPGTSGSAAPATSGSVAGTHSGPAAADHPGPAAPAQFGPVASGESDAVAPVGSGRDGATHADGARPGPLHSGPAAPADTDVAPGPATAAHHPLDPKADGARPAPTSDAHASTKSTPAHT